MANVVVTDMDETISCGCGGSVSRMKNSSIKLSLLI